jgi:hypothetical protein
VHKRFPNTVLKLFRTTQDRAVWWSEQEFKITTIEKENPKRDGTAPYPFEVEPQSTRQMITGQAIWVARSAVPRDTAYGQEYKITFEMGGKTIDPNMDCING